MTFGADSIAFQALSGTQTMKSRSTCQFHMWFHDAFLPPVLPTATLQLRDWNGEGTRLLTLPPLSSECLCCTICSGRRRDWGKDPRPSVVRQVPPPWQESGPSAALGPKRPAHLCNTHLWEHCLPLLSALLIHTPHCCWPFDKPFHITWQLFLDSLPCHSPCLVPGDLLLS